MQTVPLSNSNLTITDSDSLHLQSATISILNFETGDELAVTIPGNSDIVFDYSGMLYSNRNKYKITICCRQRSILIN